MGYHVDEFTPIIISATISTCLLLIEHLVCWFWLPARKLAYGPRYTLGTLALGLGMVVWGVLTDRLISAVAFFTIAGSGGALVVAAYWLIATWLQEIDGVDKRAFLAGTIAKDEGTDGAAGGSGTQ